MKQHLLPSGRLKLRIYLPILFLCLLISSCTQRQGQKSVNDNDQKEISRTNSDIPDPDITSELYLDRGIGIGMSKVMILVNKEIKVYNKPDGKSIGSLSFKMVDKTIEFDKTPKNFNPEYVDLPYNMLFMKAISQQGTFLEVVTNKEDNTTAWIEKKDLRFLPWSEFLFTIHSVNSKDLTKYPVLIKPDPAADRVSDLNAEQILKPLIIQSEWMQVEIYDDEFNPVQRGWIQWRNEKEMLINLNLFG